MSFSNHTPKGDPCEICQRSPLVHRPSHNPKGDPCECGAKACNHRVKHAPDGDPCSCGAALYNHVKREKETRSKDSPSYYMGIDGEGQGRENHRYILLAACDENGGRKYKAENIDGLSTEDCLLFIMSLPRHARLFSFSFGYDLTKILQDVDNEILYKLFRPDLRQRPPPMTIQGPKPIKWGQFFLNLQGTKFTVYYKGKRRVIWDIFKFFQCKFVNALKDWKVGDATLIERMSEMKDKRSEFDKVGLSDITQYCFEECQHMAELAHKLTDAHQRIGLRLTGYYGAGSSASAMLRAMGIKDKIVKPPAAMQVPVASAFFGGRFEVSVIGTVTGTIYSYDISSAYPYQLCFLPCLVHADWRFTTNRRDLFKGKTALVRYKQYREPKSKMTWGPLPFRMKDGTITYPSTSGGGWVWRAEYIQAEKLFSNVEFVSAWVCYSECDCKPFVEIPRYYLERIRIGKEGAGIAIKLAMNANYGKLAQSLGTAQFNSWVWAGLITSGTRAQLLEMLGLHKNRANMLMAATDGIYTKERLKCPIPLNTHTDLLLDGNVNPKPLGGWEEKIIEKGVFIARPGIYYPLNPSKSELKEVRGRGIGKSVVLENWEKIIQAYEKVGTRESALICEVVRFRGAKTSISRSGIGTPEESYNRSDKYGQWEPRPVNMSFDPMPKRARLLDDGTLELRALPTDKMSSVYTRAGISAEARELYQATIEAMEQPDGGDLSDYEPGEFVE